MKIPAAKSISRPARAQAGVTFIEIIIVFTMVIMMTTIIYASIGGVSATRKATAPEEVQVWEEVREDDYYEEFEKNRI